MVFCRPSKLQRANRSRVLNRVCGGSIVRCLQFPKPAQRVLENKTTSPPATNESALATTTLAPTNTTTVASKS